jgi:hypothetical protein
MQINPSVVIGLGSTGKHIVSSLRKFVYEVLNTESLDIFRFIVVETDGSRSDEDHTPGSSDSNPLVNIHVDDVGLAYGGLKHLLQSDFNWCPPDMRIDGPGAGNKRAGGRLMLLANMGKVEKAIEQALMDVKQAAQSAGPARKIQELLAKRGVASGSAPIGSNVSVYVVGTLAGGTCSGTCIDIGYMVHRLAPGTLRQATFVVPDNQANPVFKANSWAAIQDLAYFCDHPDAYRISWATAAGNKSSWDVRHRPTAPFHRVYLISRRDQQQHLQLEYSSSPASPLLVMAGLQLAVNLLGAEEIRQARLVNLNQHIGTGNRIENMFLNYSLRAVSYPKYEITEAGACRTISNSICGTWLDSEFSHLRGIKQPIQTENIELEGRAAFNQMCPPIWAALSEGVHIDELVDRVLSGEIAKVGEELRNLFGEDKEGTYYRLVQQHVDTRRISLEDELSHLLAKTLKEKQNLKYAGCLLEGVLGEIQRATRYWSQFGVPLSGDGSAWRSYVKTQVEEISGRKSAIGSKVLISNRDLLRDELSELLSKLEIFLMAPTILQLSEWVTKVLKKRLERLSDVLQRVDRFARIRDQQIIDALGEIGGPVLKMSRSEHIDFNKEVQNLTEKRPDIPEHELIDLPEAGWTGLFGFSMIPEKDEDRRTFIALKDRLQPALLRELEKGGTVNVVQEVDRRGLLQQVVQRGTVTQRLSIPVKMPLATDPDVVPSYLFASSSSMAEQLKNMCRAADQAFPDFQPQALPIFDHLAVFYQEGARLRPEYLMDADDFSSALDAEKRANTLIVDPLRELRASAESSAAVGTENWGAQ